ncbi:MAG TPA: hypothetical protein VMT19_01475 [Thermoanaerobaculaceae bacterium]|nr:hypothetical protein [Thermoanaerobaculaceae bacterium]
MSPWRARLAVLAVFLAGFLCGAVTLHLTRFRLQRHVLDSPAGVAGIIVHRLDRELHLTSAQKKQIEASAVRAREEAAKVMQPLMPQMTAIFERMRTETRAVLDADQRRRFDRMIERRPPPFERMWGPAPPGHEATPRPAPTPVP